ncbi:MAG: poly-gamma-glutamate synthase PgsB [Eubacteriales bacterium]|nr:poly-gamma-glutamate synthase PgsB [Eubacteriales bacterium]
MMMLTWFIFAACVFLIVALLIERILLKRAREKIRTVIHVNGTRGKSTIVRLIDAGLRQNSKLQIYSKITGTKPAVIDTQGRLLEIKRRGRANIKEQVRQLIKAARQGTEIFIVECMAILPELQKICEERILHADILVLSNVRNDHIPEMGNSLEEVALAFTHTFPKEGIIFTGEKRYNQLFADMAKAKNSRLIQVELDSELTGLESWPPFLRENVALALAVCEELGVERQAAWAGMKNYLPDPYAFREYALPDGAIFANALTANDPESTGMILDWLLSKENLQGRQLIILLNYREDRPARTREMLAWAEQQDVDELWLLGKHKLKQDKSAKKFTHYTSVDKLPLGELKGNELIFAVGNVGEAGFQLLHLVEERAIKYV